MNIQNMTNEQIDGLLTLALTNVMIDRYPLERQEVREHVMNALYILNIGLLNESASQISGALNEVVNVYSVKVY